MLYSLLINSSASDAVFPFGASCGIFPANEPETPGDIRKLSNRYRGDKPAVNPVGGPADKKLEGGCDAEGCPP